MNRNIGDYLSKLKELKKGDAKVLAALKDLKDLHRNPLVHPEHSLENADEAIALLGGVQAVIIPMLKEIPAQPLPGQTALPTPDAASGAPPAKKTKGK